MNAKINWQGVLLAIQPRIRLLRSFDERSHDYRGYVLRLQGTIGDEEREFTVGIGVGAHEKHQFSAGDQVAGVGVPVADPRFEIAELYRISGIKLIAPGARDELVWH